MICSYQYARKYKKSVEANTSCTVPGQFLSLGCRLADFKNLPTVETPTCNISLFPGACARCAPRSVALLVNPTVKILSQKNILSVIKSDVWSTIIQGCSLANLVVLKLLRSVFSRGIIVASGQIEIIKAASKLGKPLVLAARYSNPWDYVIYRFLLWYYGIEICAIQMHQNHKNLSWITKFLMRKLDVVDDFSLSHNLIGGMAVQVWLDSSLDVQYLMNSSSPNSKDVILIPTINSYEVHKDWKFWLGGNRVRVDFDQPVFLSEMASRQSASSLTRHINYSIWKLGKITPSQLVAFVFRSKYTKSSDLVEVARGVSEVRDLLLERGAVLAFSGDSVEAVKCGIHYLGGTVCEGEIQLPKADLAFCSESVAVEQYFIPEAVVAVGVKSLLSKSLNCTKIGNKQHCSSVSQLKLVEAAGNLLSYLGEDTIQSPPCIDPMTVILEGISRLERKEAIGKLEEKRESQHGHGKFTRRVARQVDFENVWHSDEEDNCGFNDTLIAVGISVSGRMWLNWVADIIQYRIRNHLYVMHQLHVVRERGIIQLENFVHMVKKSFAKRLENGWEVDRYIGSSDLIHKTIKDLLRSQIPVIKLTVSENTVWLGLAEQFYKTVEVDQLCKEMLEFKM